MSNRTSPRDVVKRISWFLSYHEGDDLSINEIAEGTGLAWATVHNYIHTLEITQNVTPDITTTDDGVAVETLTDPVAELLDQPGISLAVYLFFAATANGDKANEPIPIEDHEAVLDQYSDTVDELESLGWVERTDNTITLTPQGIGIAGPAQSRVTNQPHAD